MYLILYSYFHGIIVNKHEIKSVKLELSESVLKCASLRNCQLNYYCKDWKNTIVRIMCSKFSCPNQSFKCFENSSVLSKDIISYCINVISSSQTVRTDS